MALSLAPEKLTIKLDKLFGENKMTKQQKAIAEIIRKNFGDSWRTASKLAEYFSLSNKRFNKQKFLYACLNKAK